MNEISKRIENRKNKIGNRKKRKMLKYSDNYTTMFNFFLNSYRKGLLTFCGSKINVYQSLDMDDGKFCFRKFENGDYQLKDMYSKHPNILKAAITGKKSWGLFLNQWAEGIVSCDFTIDEIVKDFEDNNIKIPNVLFSDFMNRINKLKIEKYESYLKEKYEHK